MVEFADLIGVPFQYGGRGPDTFDCYGLVMELYRRQGVTLPDFLSPTDQGAQAALGAIKLQQWVEVPCQHGAMAAIRIGQLISHCGYVLDEGRIIHTWAKLGGVSVQRLDVWKRNIIGYYRYAK